MLHERFTAAAVMNDTNAMDAVLASYGEGIVQAVGDEVDRIERRIVEVEPSIHYVDLETN